MAKNIRTSWKGKGAPRGGIGVKERPIPGEEPGGPGDGDVIDQALQTMKQMVSGIQMWRKAWRDMQKWATEGRPEPVKTPQELLGRTRQGLSEAGNLFRRWWGYRR